MCCWPRSSVNLDQLVEGGSGGGGGEDCNRWGGILACKKEELFLAKSLIVERKVVI